MATFSEPLHCQEGDVKNLMTPLVDIVIYGMCIDLS